MPRHPPARTGGCAATEPHTRHALPSTNGNARAEAATTLDGETRDPGIRCRPGRRDARHLDHVPRREGARRRRLPHVPGRGALAHGRERRRQVDAHQGAHRRVRHRRRHHHARGRRGVVQRAGAGAGRGHLHRLPGGEPPAEPVGGREHHARPRAAPIRLDRLARHAAPRGRAAREPQPRDRPRIAARRPFARRAAARRDRPRDRRAGEGPHPRRAHVVARRRRGRRALPRHPLAEGAGRRDPLRLALPRPGLRDLRPHHRAAQRPTGRRVLRRGTAPTPADLEDDR